MRKRARARARTGPCSATASAPAALSHAASPSESLRAVRVCGQRCRGDRRRPHRRGRRRDHAVTYSDPSSSPLREGEAATRWATTAGRPGPRLRTRPTARPACHKKAPCHRQHISGTLPAPLRARLAARREGGQGSGAEPIFHSACPPPPSPAPAAHSGLM